MGLNGYAHALYMPHALGHVTSVSTAADKTRRHALWPLFHWFLPFVFWFLLISILLPVDEWASWLSPWPFGRTILWGARCRIAAWLAPVLTAMVGALLCPPSASVAESFSRDDLLALVRDEFARLMQQQQTNPSLSVSLAPPG